MYIAAQTNPTPNANSQTRHAKSINNNHVDPPQTLSSLHTQLNVTLNIIAARPVHNCTYHRSKTRTQLYTPGTRPRSLPTHLEPRTGRLERCGTILMALQQYTQRKNLLPQLRHQAKPVVQQQNSTSPRYPLDSMIGARQIQL